MSIQRMLYQGDPILRRPCEPIGDFDAGVQSLIQDLKDTLNSTTGLGLAAPQIGVSKQIFIYDADRKNGDGKYKVLINPRLLNSEGEAISKMEGCKSAPAVRVDVPRGKVIDIEGIDETGQPVRYRAENEEAIVIQHELDHLEGKLVTDHLDLEARQSYQRRLANFERGSRNPASVGSLIDIFERLQPMIAHPQGVVFSQNVGKYQILVIKSGSQIQLYFGKPSVDLQELNMSGIMSRIDVERPLNLLGLYTQAMMLCLLWNSSPRLAHMIGFGGGRIPMVLHYYFPELIVESTEIDRAVVGLATRYFGISLDDRMRVFVQDGRDYLKNLVSNIRYDVIFVDCFTGAGLHPYALSTIEFYQLCKSHLVDGGVIVSNLVASDPMFGQKVNTLVRSFKYAWRFEHENADVFFGSDRNLDREEAGKAADELHERLGFDFPFRDLARHLHRITVEVTDQFGEMLSDKADGYFRERLSADDPLFRRAKRNDPCPCGSGKKFKKCHGSAS